MLPGLALCAVRWIHSSIASRLHLLSEISHRVFRHVPRRREKHDFLVDPRQRATSRKRKTRSGSMLAADTKRDMSQLKIVVELPGKFRLASIVGWFFSLSHRNASPVHRGSHPMHRSQIIPRAARRKRECIELFSRFAQEIFRNC